MRVFLLILVILTAKICCGQDSTTAVYINDAVQKIEGRLLADIMEKKDTSIFDESDSLQKGAFLSVHTEFYTDPQSMLLDKIIERSLYKRTSTELTIYFLGNQPIMFSNKQWEGSTVRYDFSIYYMNDNPVFISKRCQLNGTPDSDSYLKWCYELRKEYFGIVNEYNQTFAKAKVKSR
jgi:hypothetical protein